MAVAVLFGVWLAHGGIGRVATVDPATNYLLSSFVFVLGILVARRLPSAPPLGKTRSFSRGLS